ncbi:MAG: glycosyltransferase family 2 protein [Pseudomonadota bacterium]
MSAVANRTGSIGRDDVLCVLCVRNEMQRLPHFLEHYRKLGVAHFLIVDNGSHDGTSQYLSQADDVSLWKTDMPYKPARYGMDWLNWLLLRYGRGHWCLSVDADEVLLYPDHEAHALPALTRWLDAHDIPAMGALMLDLYPKGSPDRQTYVPGQAPWSVLNWFDAFGYWSVRHRKTGHLKVQGGIRARKFFALAANRAPTLNKIPLVRWRWGYVYMNSTHNMLPPELEAQPPDRAPSGVLLHTKFLPGVSQRAVEERDRGQHFSDARAYSDYYASLATSPDLWDSSATEFENAKQLEDLGLLFRGDWGGQGKGQSHCE